MVAAAVTHPLDLAKVRMQTAHIPGSSMISTLVNVVKHEGFFAIYSGLQASLLRQATYSTTRFAAYEHLKDKLTDPSGKTPPVKVLLPISMFSGCLGGLVGTPADIVNVRMQNDKALPIEERRNYKNVIDAFSRMIKEEGVGSLYRGVWPNSMRAILMTASQVVSYDESKKIAVAYLNADPKSYSTHFGCSLFAGLVATTVCSPVDVVKTRVMNASKTSHGNINSFSLFINMVRKEGPRFMFRGWLPAFVRLGPQTIVTFVVLEQLRKWKLGM
ncbi:hypothetical protein CANCADRAFT_31550 [Tortispora caseinolytica NRRL Y-17796]|uniref:Mitochondrial dicarboxylate transporter n=1 Tax=Tortispora caseinolytica NRRL Y-17796 TaxID=767744 RepID=A0A1E4TFW7_9ASCO|nr:hypothetical protein CANCADRAFT_31550 [Tortispora caseinolytica NRRL Y-17796]